MSKMITAVNDTNELRKNQHYNSYYNKKMELIEGVEDDKLKRKIICDLMFMPEGDFQKFIWDNLSDFDKLQMERKANGKKRGPRVRESSYIQE